MAYGIECYSPSGAIIFSLAAEGGGLFLGTFDVPATGSNVTQTYTIGTGKTVIFAPVGTSAVRTSVNTAVNLSLASCTVSYSGGVATLTAVPQGRASRIYVFVQ